jgi:hypothetical protein
LGAGGNVTGSRQVNKIHVRAISITISGWSADYARPPYTISNGMRQILPRVAAIRQSAPALYFKSMIATTELQCTAAGAALECCAAIMVL